MYKKFLVSLTAIATSLTMVIAPSLTAFAEDTETTPSAETSIDSQTGPVTYLDNGSLTVEGDVTADNGRTAIEATGSTTEITVTGAVDAKDTHTIGDYVISNPAVKAHDGATITVKNSEIKPNAIVGGNEAIAADNGATVIAEGSISAIGTEHTVTYYDKDGNLTGTGVVYSSTGAYSDGTANIKVEGDVSSQTIGINMNPTQSGNGGWLVIEGTINTSQNSGIGISASDLTRYDSEGNITHQGVNYASVEEGLAALPTVIVYGIDANTPVHVNFGDTEATINNEIAKQFAEAINYIVKIEDNSYGITTSGTTETKDFTDTTYDTVTIKDAFKVAANLPDGYTISGGNNVSVTDNGDGTFTLKLANNKGGINIHAILKPVTNNDGSTSYEVVVEETAPYSDPNQEAAPYSDPNQAPAGAIVVNTSTAVDTTMAAISGDKPARTVSYNMANITPLQYKNSIIENVSSAPASGAFNIETDRVACFDSKMIEAIATRPDIDVNVVFTYGGKKLKVTIPAGYDVRTLLDSNGYCGFLRLMSILGATEL